MVEVNGWPKFNSRDRRDYRADTLSISYIVAHLHRRVAIIGQGHAGHAGPNKLERLPRRFAPAI